MLAFVQAQMDYIYFFYGLAFIFLAVICFLMRRQFKSGPVWFLLGMFGVLHGFNEWTDLVGMIIGSTSQVFHIIRLLLLISSFACLFEFARQGFNSIYKNKIGSWVYGLIILILFLSWHVFGELGLEIFARFILGIGGAVGAGLVFRRFNFLSKEHKDKFCLGAVAFWLYALSLVVNPAGQVLGIPYTDQNIFLNSLGLPIQLIKGSLAVAISVCLWSHYQASIYKEITAQRVVKKTAIGSYLVITLLALFFAGWLFCNMMDSLAYKEIIANNKKLSNMLASDTERVLSEGGDLSQVMSGSPNIINLLQNYSPESVQAANLILDRYKATTNVDIAYILNKDGTTIATSNRDASDNLLGKNYAFRPYFIEAIGGKPSILFAVGVTTKKSGFYSSHPVKDSLGNIIGVAVIKVSLSAIEQNFKQYGSIFLVSPEGVIFLSGNPKYNLKSFQPISLEDKRRLYKSQQFAKGDFEAIHDHRPINNEVINLDGESLLLNVMPINGAGWELFKAYSTKLVVYYRFFGIVLTLVFYFLTIAFFIIVEDIKRSAALAYFASVVLSSDDAIVGVDLAGNIISWNKGVEKIYGYSKDEILGKNLSIAIPQKNVKGYQLILNRIAAGRSVEHFETVHIKKNGQLMNVSLTFSPIKNEIGEVVGVSVVARDVTREKDIEDNLKKQMIELEKFKLATDSSADMIVITDKDAHVLYANKAAEINTGYSKKEMDTDYIGNLWGGHMEKDFYQKMWHTIKDEKKIWVGEIKNRRKSGEEYYVNARFYPLLDNLGNVRFFVGMETDITKSKEIDRMKSEFVSVASHQLRTPLTGIKWFSELLIKGKAGSMTAEQNDYIQQVADSNERMIKLVDDLLDVSHIDEAGKFKIILIKENFSSVIQEVVDQQKIQANEKKIKIKLNPGCLKKVMLKVDRFKLEQAIQNILNNAIKYSPNGSTISVDCEKKDDQLVCSFKDKGIGIPLYQQHRMFEKFFRADNVITVGSGTGLGLYISKFIVEGHGGKIWFESKENKGTTFFISLPIK